MQGGHSSFTRDTVNSDKDQWQAVTTPMSIVATAANYKSLLLIESMSKGMMHNVTILIL